MVDGEPSFTEPWEAQVFALAVELGRAGLFQPGEWSAALGAELSDKDGRYYEAWLAAVEKLAVAKGLTDADTLAARKEAWEEAYHTTPHGQPVSLR